MVVAKYNIEIDISYESLCGGLFVVKQTNQVAYS